MSVFEFREWIERSVPMWVFAVPVIIVVWLVVFEKRRK